MVHTVGLVGLKDREGHLSLKFLVGKARIRMVTRSVHGKNLT
jgi:hypothetical protein